MGKHPLSFPAILTTVLSPKNKRKKKKKKKKVLDRPVASGDVPSGAGALEAVWPSLAEQLQCCAQVGRCRRPPFPGGSALVGCLGFPPLFP